VSAVKDARPFSGLDRQVEYWNRVGPAKPFSHPVNLARLHDLVAPDARIVDVGCGYGRTLGILRRDGYTRLAGLDIAPAMIAAAQQNVPGAHFDVIATGQPLPAADVSADLVLLFSVLTCIPTDDGQRELIAECARILAPGGVLYVADLWLQSDTRNIERYRHDWERYRTYGVFALPEGVVVRHHDRAWMNALLGGFDTIAVDEVAVTTMNGNRADGFQWCCRKPQD
jgi:SAM-dependent methyltransferase